MFVRTLTGFLKGREFATKERRRRVQDRPALREDGKERTSFEHAEHLKNHLLDYYKNLRLHNANGYIAPRNMLEGLAQAIQKERERKLKTTRKEKRFESREMWHMLTARCKTEDDFAGEQLSRVAMLLNSNEHASGQNRQSLNIMFYDNSAMPRKTQGMGTESPKKFPVKMRRRSFVSVTTKTLATSSKFTNHRIRLIEWMKNKS